jgi:hypothetical protein
MFLSRREIVGNVPVDNRRSPVEEESFMSLAPVSIQQRNQKRTC